jgi:hypothetical protein
MSTPEFEPVGARWEQVAAMQQVGATERIHVKSEAEAPGGLSEKLAALTVRRQVAIRRAFTRLHPLALGCALGTVAGLAVLGGTLLLVLRGGPRVGANLIALSSYFPGFRVDVPGALLGGVYGFAAGFLAGYAIAAFRNLALQIVLAYARWSAEWWRRRHMLDEI